MGVSNTYADSCSPMIPNCQRPDTGLNIPYDWHRRTVNMLYVGGNVSSLKADYEKTNRLWRQVENKSIRLGD